MIHHLMLQTAEPSSLWVTNTLGGHKEVQHLD